jgi:hypothetical protein
MAELPILTSRSLIVHLAPVHLAWTLVAGAGRRNDCSAGVAEVGILQVQRVEGCDAGALEGQFDCYVVALSVGGGGEDLVGFSGGRLSGIPRGKPTLPHLLLATRRTRPVSVCPCFTNSGF